MKILDHIMEGNEPLRVITGLTTAATAGNRSTHAHGLTRLGRKVTPAIAIAVPVAPDADGAYTAPAVHVVKVDDTNVTVRADAASVPFTLLVG